MDAYRYFFPAGWLMALWGVLLWILFPWGLVEYPGTRHPEIMMGGFFLCFVAGFLMTAAPRFTGTEGPSPAEHRGAGTLIGLLLLSAFAWNRIFFYAVVVGVFIFLLAFMYRRFRKRKSNPPDSFVFVGFGLLSGLGGSVILFCSQFRELPSPLLNTARVFILQAYILALVIGVGSRLVPALLGFQPLPTDKRAQGKPRTTMFWGLAVLLTMSFLLEGFFLTRWGYVLRSLLLTAILIPIWKIHRLPVRKAVQTFSIWISAWALLLGHWAIVIFPDARVHILHVILVCGLALMTLMIAVRVTLSHGGHDLVVEKKSKALAVGGFLIFGAGLTRLSAGFAARIYASHLQYAAFTFIVGLMIWGLIFIPRMIVVRAKGD